MEFVAVNPKGHCRVYYPAHFYQILLKGKQFHP
jgi:hypothetical protein